VTKNDKDAAVLATVADGAIVQCRQAARRST
jgi:hypothetical protein